MVMQENHTNAHGWPSYTHTHFHFSKPGAHPQAFAKSTPYAVVIYPHSYFKPGASWLPS